jgi:thiamine kinase-like enzyme
MIDQDGYEYLSHHSLSLHFSPSTSLLLLANQKSTRRATITKILSLSFSTNSHFYLHGSIYRVLVSITVAALARQVAFSSPWPLYNKSKPASRVHSLARGHLRIEDVAPFLSQEVADVHTSTYQTHFTHADLCPRNIIVRNGCVAAIIDWEFARWYLEYWEFTKANYNYFLGEDWEDYLRLAFPYYEAELAAERVLWERLRLPESGTRYVSYRDGVSCERPGSDPSVTWLDGRKERQSIDPWSIVLP